MSASHRDEVIRLYAYTQVTTEGVVKKTYVFRQEVWAAVVDRGATDVMSGAKPQQRVDATAAIDIDLTVLKTDLVKRESGRYYYIRGLQERRNMDPPEWGLDLEFVDTNSVNFTVSET